jgi:thioredoxin-related protein
MKKATLFLILFTVLSQVNLFSQVKFADLSWDDAKKQALKENKLIFIDAYTDWCGWCKKMDKETFADTNVAKFMNTRFISLKLNMEQGFGKRLAMKFHVRSFPTYLVCSPEGRLLYTTDGYSASDEFIGILTKAMDKTYQTPAKGMSDDIDIPFPNFYQLQFEPQSIKKVADSATVHTFLDKQTDLFSEINWAIMYVYPTNNKYNQYFLDNIATYRDLYGSFEPNQKLYSIYFNRLQYAIRAKDETKLQEVIDMIGKYSTENVEREKIFYRILYYKELQDWTKLTDNVNEMIRLAGYEYPRMINEYAWAIYRSCDDDGILRSALEWMKNLVQSDPESFFYLNTYAALQFKLKYYDEAEKYAQMALAAGKKANEKTKSTEDLLQKIANAKNPEKK